MAVNTHMQKMDDERSMKREKALQQLHQSVVLRDVFQMVL